MATKPVLPIIGNDPVTGANITKEPLNTALNLINDYTEDVSQDSNTHIASLSAHLDSSITNTSLVSGSKVSDALNTTKQRIDGHVDGTTEKHDASEINNDSIVTGANVATALNTIKSQVDTLVVTGTTNTTIGVYSLNVTGVNTYVGTVSGLTLFGGQKLNVTFVSANTGNSTLNINSLGAKPIKITGVGGKRDPMAGELIAGATYQVQYDGTDYVIITSHLEKRVYDLESRTDVYGIKWNVTDDIVTRTGQNTSLSNFNNIFPWSDMKRCNLSDAGAVNAYYGDPTYIENGTNGQVMVEIPQFYSRYKYWTEGGKDYIQWDISAIPYADFEIDPAFVKGVGYTKKVYISAYEGSIYDTSTLAYLLADEQVADFTVTTGDKLSSIASAKPCSGLTQDLTLPKSRIIANNRGAGWGLWNGLQVYAVQKLLFIEYGSFNSQTAIGQGVVNKASGTGNESEITGATSFLGNTSGRQSGTDGLTSVSYRGVENMWGNIWAWVDGINIQADNKLWINPTNQSFVSDSFVTPYELQGTLWNVNGYVSNILKKNVGLFATASSGSSSTRIPDYYYQSTGNLVACLGGSWSYGSLAGSASWHLLLSSASRSRSIGARLCYQI